MNCNSFSMNDRATYANFQEWQTLYQNIMEQPLVGTVPVKRSRWRYLAATLVVILLGLASRSERLDIPWFIAKYAGDTLWGLVVFVGLGFLFPRQSTLAVGILAIAFACSVEFSQLFHPPWLDAIRAYRLAGLVLGTPSATFAWGDIGSYLVGIAGGIAAELAIYRRREPDEIPSGAK